jgi:alanine dehydrogenase
VTVAAVLFLSEAEVASLLDVDELLDALAGAFRGLSADHASVPPRIAALAELGMLGAMPVYLPGVALGRSWSRSSRATTSGGCRRTRP